MTRSLGRINIFIWILLFPLLSEAQHVGYAVKLISPELLKKASAVIRTDNRTFNIINFEKGSLEHVFAVTILNKKADHLAQLVLPYDKFTEVGSIEAKIFNSNGEEIGVLKKKNILDISDSENQLSSDNRLKVAKLTHGNYPYTVEFKYTQVFNGLLFYPSWAPQNSPDIAVQNSNFTIVTPSDFEIRYKEYNLKYPVEISKGSNSTTYRWNAGDLPPFEEEDFGKTFLDQMSKVVAGPVKFKIDDYEGQMDSWLNFGNFIYELNKGRDQLPAEIVQKINELTASVPDTVDKIKAVYKFLQSNTRYVNVALGIGGWQPIEAKKVSKNGYGDCKGLVNYMKAMLQSLNIDAYYTLVSAGYNAPKIDEDFPVQAFNHVILTVPLSNDTIWLECTSQISPFGYLGSFSGNRKALLVKRDESKLIQTKSYPLKSNKKVSATRLKISSNGVLNVSAHVMVCGLEIDRTGLLTASKKNKLDQKRWIYKNLDFPNFTLDSFNILGVTDSDEPIIEKEVHVSIPQYATMNEDLIVLNMNPYEQEFEVPGQIKERSTDIILRDGSSRIDTIILEIPKGYNLAQFPNNQNIKSDFGTFSASFTLDKKTNSIQYVQQMVFNDGIFLPGEYNNMRRFYMSIAKIWKAEVIFSKT